MNFQIISAITDIEAIASGRGIRCLTRLKAKYGGVKWKKMKGVAKVRLGDGTEYKAEVHWYESHGIGRREEKIKHLLP